MTNDDSDSTVSLATPSDLAVERRREQPNVFVFQHAVWETDVRNVDVAVTHR